MNDKRHSLSFALIASLAAACSDTGDSNTNNNTNNTTSGSTLTEASTSSTSSTSVDPTPSTTGATEPAPTTGSTTTTEPATTSTTTSGSSTTGTPDPFFCEVDMEGCCEAEIAAIADTFFTDAEDQIGTPGCVFVQNPPPDAASLPCEHWSFGHAPKLQIFKDDELVWVEVISGASALALRFPMQDGELLVDDQPVPWALVQSAVLQLDVEIDWQTFSDLEFQLSGLPADQAWTEGDGPGAVPCRDGDSSLACRGCGPTPGDPCESPWAGLNPLMNPLGLVPGQQGLDPGKLELEIADPAWLIDAPNGLVVLPHASTIDGQPVLQVPKGAITVSTRESGAPATLRVRLCAP